MTKPKILRSVPLAVLASLLVIGFAVGRFVLFDPASSVASVPKIHATDTATDIKKLKQALKRNPDDVVSLQTLAAKYLQLSLDTLDTSYYPLAQDALDRADAVQPGLDRTLIARGVLDLGRHQFAAAREDADRVLAHTAASADALAVAYDASIELGYYDDAAGFIQRALDLRPGLPAYSRLSYLRELHGDIKSAIVLMREANVAAGRRGNAGITTFLGDLQFGQGNLDQAEDEYRTALRILPGFSNATLGLGRVLAVRGNVSEAVRLLQEIDGRAPSPAVAELLGDIEDSRGHAKAAQAWYARVRELTGVQAKAGENTSLELGLFEVEHAETPAEIANALAIAQYAYAVRPANVFVNDLLAFALYRSGNPTEAWQHMLAALRLGTQNARVHYHAALILDALGDDAGARTELQTALDLNPWFTFHDRGAVEDFAAREGVELSSS